MDGDLYGPQLYAVRRAQWLTPTAAQSRPVEASSSRRKLEQLLSAPGAVMDDEVWYGSVEKIWKGLGAGARLKRRLPMKLVIKIIHAAWLRDNTWPMGAIAPEPDDEQQESEIPPAPVPNSATSSGISTPWTLVGSPGDASA